MSDQFLFVQNQASTLAGSGCVIGDTTIILNSFTTIDGVQLTMADFGAVGYATIEPDNSSQEEQISFSGVTANANGTTSLTGVKHVLFTSPYTETSGVTKTHPGGVKLIITNSSGFYNKLTSKDNDEIINGSWQFIQSPIVPTPVSASLTAAASVEYVNNVAISGAAKATTSVFGISRLSTAPVTASVPIVVGDNDTRMLTQAENDAAAGTSGSPSSTNKFITNNDSTTAVVVGSVVRRNSAGDLTVNTTPTASTDAASKSYVDSLSISATKVSAFAQNANSTTSVVIAHGLGRTPKMFSVSGVGAGGDGLVESSGFYNGTTNACNFIWFDTNGNLTGSGIDTTAAIWISYASSSGSGLTKYIKGVVTWDATNVTITFTNGSTGNSSFTINYVYSII